jgi:hypothetical protein
MTPPHLDQRFEHGRRNRPDRLDDRQHQMRLTLAQRQILGRIVGDFS